MGENMNERILIIEDDQAILKLLQRGLAYEGYTVDTAMDGRTGLILARDHTPDLVILDWIAIACARVARSRS
jgi:DNA-binding response OmpR family regulator